MSTKIVLLNDKGQQMKANPAKSGGKLLAQIASGRVTLQNVTAAKKLLASKVAEVLEQYPVIVIETRTEKEHRVTRYSKEYLEKLAAVDTALFSGVQVELISTNRGRRKSKQEAEDDLEI